jgi:protein TonB
MDPTHGSPPPGRPKYRPPIGMPLSRPPRWTALTATLLHLLLLALLVITPGLMGDEIPDEMQGAGGPGPAGGGGGGTRGTGGGEHVVERLQYIHVQEASPQPQVQPPIEEEKKEPEVPPPVEEKKLDPVVELDLEMPTTKLDLALTAGVGGGTGNDGTSGTGPGRGGGVGSGVGTGRGTGVGPGTGGGEGEIYPPSPDFLVIPPMPKPRKVIGQVVKLKYQVDVDGSVLAFEFTPTTDSDYNERIREQFKEVKFKPAVRWDGQPVVGVAVLTLKL